MYSRATLRGQWAGSYSVQLSHFSSGGKLCRTLSREPYPVGRRAPLRSMPRPIRPPSLAQRDALAGLDPRVLVEPEAHKREEPGGREERRAPGDEERGGERGREDEPDEDPAEPEGLRVHISPEVHRRALGLVGHVLDAEEVEGDGQRARAHRERKCPSERTLELRRSAHEERRDAERRGARDERGDDRVWEQQRALPE